MWTQKDIIDQSGKIALVTGANSGIGLEAAIALYQAGAHVILACRDIEKAAAAQQQIRSGGGKGTLEPGILNLSSLEDIARFSVEISSRHQKIDLLINNAGVMTPPASKTDDGYELQFGVNFLGHFALTARLYPLLKNAGAARVVILSSGAHKMAEAIDFDNLRSERSYEPFREYAISKLADMQFMLELQRRLEKAGSEVISLGAHPGVTVTGLARFMPEEDYKAAMERFGELMPAWQGALPGLYAATSAEATAGGYYGPDGENELKGYPAPAVISSVAQDENAADKLWAYAENASGLRFL